MNQGLEDRIAAYLDGLLPVEEAEQFEQDLLEEDVAAAFRQTLLLQELLGDLPPDEPPPGLVERIEASVGLKPSAAHRKEKTAPNSSLGRVVQALGWGLNWPGYLVSGLLNGSTGLRDSLSGMNAIGYSLGPLQEPARERLGALGLPKRPLWRIALSRLW